MNKKWCMVFVAVFMAGIVLGLVDQIRLEATTSIGESSSGNVLLVFDENWTAIEAMVSKGSNGTYEIKDPSTENTFSDVARVATDSVNHGYLEPPPDFIVTQWLVHGHIHYL